MIRNLLKGLSVFLSIGAAVVIFSKVAIIRSGGPVMVPILLSSIFAFAVIFEKFSQFARETSDTDALLKNVFESIDRQRIKEAIDVCDHANTGVSRVLKSGIMKYDRAKEEIKEAMQDSFLYEMPFLEEKMPILATIIEISPLLGFLGTLTGLMSIFKVIEAKTTSLLSLSAVDFSSGIERALIC